MLSAYKSDMNNVAEIIGALGGNAKVAQFLSVRDSTVSEMKRRKSIPVSYWPELIRMAESSGIEGITSDSLMLIHSEKEAAESTSQERASA